MHAQKVIGPRNRSMGYKIETKMLQVPQDVNKSATRALNKDEHIACCKQNQTNQWNLEGPLTRNPSLT